MKYKSVAATRYGGPEVLQVVEKDLRPPAPGEVRIRVQAAPVCRPDFTLRTGQALYTGTPLGYKLPFVPGYSVVGVVDAVGERVRQAAVGDRVGVLCVIGGYTEYLYWPSNRLIPVPNTLDPAEASTILLNYIVAYQTMHRVAQVKPGEKILVIGASGGIGTALLQLGQLAGLTMYAVASGSKCAVLKEYGAVPIDYRTQDFLEVIRQCEPDGLDAVISGMTTLDDISRGLATLRKGGKVVCFGEPGSRAELFRILGTLLATNLQPHRKSIALYGTSTYFLGSRRPYQEDWALLFRLLAEGKIKPIVAKKYAILEAAQANALLESGQVVGNVVLVAPDLL